MNDSTVISCNDLEKSFVDAELNIDVLRGVNLTVSNGECIAIIGSSGSGKSTLLHLLGGLDTPTKGEIRVTGRTFSTLSETERGNLRNKTLGFVYQFHHLLPEFTALENVAMPLLIRREKPEVALNTANEILEKVGLKERVQHKPGEMSGGERQRAAIARALVTNPKCILADEPTGNLDEHTAEKVFNILLDLNDVTGTSLIMVTHNMELARKMTTIYELKEGKLQLFNS